MTLIYIISISLFTVPTIMFEVLTQLHFLLDKNYILRAVSLKCPAFMHIGARFPAG
jgi:hypothetical protein